MRRHVLVVAALAAVGGLIAALPAAGQDEGAGMPATAMAPAVRPAGLPHLRVDAAARRIEMDAEVVLREGPLEFVVCTRGTKEHESILATPARPSHLHAALLMLDLTPGKPAHWAESPEGKPVFVPPAGARLKLAFRYRDAEGTAVTAPANQWLLSMQTRKGVEPMEWVFVGSELLDDGRYMADATGEVVSVSNFVGSVIDVPFESSDKNVLLEFAANAEAIPPVGTAVTVVIEPVAGQQEVARAVFEIDRFGRYRLDGRPITVEQISEWARQFKARHARPYVVVQASARALVFDVERLKALLAQQRIADVQVSSKPIAGEILPRTPEQMGEAIDWWARQFADYRELIQEPGRQAEVVLRQIEYRREELGDLVNLWTDYERKLRELLGAYRAATQPADEGAPR